MRRRGDDGHIGCGACGDLREGIVHHVMGQHIGEVEKGDRFVTVVTVGVPHIGFPCVYNGDSKQGGGDAEESALSNPMLLEAQFKLPRLVNYANDIWLGEI